MQKKLCNIALATALAMAFAQSAQAHIGYGSALYSGLGVYDPLTGSSGTGTYASSANFTATVSSNAGFLAGLDSGTLGNTHDIRFRYFTLSETSTVSFTITGLTNKTVSGNANSYLNGLTASTLNPAFSLYSGVLPASSHDGVGDKPTVAGDADTAAYLATANDFAAWSPFAGSNAARGGANAGTPSNPTGLWGVFDSNGNITTGNDGKAGASDTHGANYLGNLDTPKISTIQYLGISGADAATGASYIDSLGQTQQVLGADGNVDNTVSWTGTLGPGIYTLAIGGVNLDDFADYYKDARLSSGGLDKTTGCVTTTCANLYAADRLARSLTISNFNVSAVPEPEQYSLMLSGLLIMGATAYRRRKV